MSNVSIAQLRKVFEGKREVVAIDDVDLEIEPGELLVLLGPSGCGKTTMLRSIAGLENPTSGRIEIGESVVFDGSTGVDLPPEKRDIGMVFQSYALWPHKSVRDNIGFPLKARKLKAEHKSGEWVEEAATLVDCTELLDRYPSQLSGGQQQRVALARGIVSRPTLVLMDEPLSNLDARLRDQVRGELHELHQRLGFTVVFVTHDQSEALALGDRLAVMRSGSIEHLGSPVEVFERPRTQYVADFVGFLNGVDIEWDDGVPRASAGSRLGGVEHLPIGHGEPCHVRIRPDDVELRPCGDEAEGRVRLDHAEVSDLAFMGRHMEARVKVGDQILRSNVPCRDGVVPNWLKPGGTTTVAFPGDRCQVYGQDGRRLGDG